MTARRLEDMFVLLVGLGLAIGLWVVLRHPEWLAWAIYSLTHME